tara:strand:- start:1803 stop:2120 length:318 start_codon:yes stop_codon:yes gene_type:complete
MAYFTDNDSVIDAFLNCNTANAGRLKTDGQSLFSYDLRIAEHIPQNDGTAITLVYDFTSKGGSYVSQTTSGHVGLVKRRLPRRNVVSVEEAKEAGLVEVRTNGTY